MIHTGPRAGELTALWPVVHNVPSGEAGRPTGNVASRWGCWAAILLPVSEKRG